MTWRFQPVEKGAATLKRMQRTVPLIGLLLALAVLHGSPRSYAAEPLEYYPGKLHTPKAGDLSKEEREVEARFARYLEEQTEKAITRYKEKFNKEINT
ncbi:MAG: hypothetical protein ACREP8_15735, partial [Candidatus Binatia bacterium]